MLKRLVAPVMLFCLFLVGLSTQASEIKEVKNGATMVYTPKETGYYSLLTRDESDTLIKLSNKKLALFIVDDDSGQNKNACIYYKLYNGL